MKLTKFAVIAGAAALMAGCQSQVNSTPTAGAPQIALAAMQTEAVYEVIGDAKGSSEGAVLFGFISIGGESKSGSVGGKLVPVGADPVKDAAVYNAIESVPGADSIIAPRVNREVTSYFIYKEEKVTVKGKAIRIKAKK